MNKKLYFLPISIFLFSCSYHAYQGTEKIKSITDVPLVGTTDTVDVFFTNDIPAVPYYKVKMVDATANSYANYEELLSKLKANAKKEGLDAVLIIDQRERTHYYPISTYQINDQFARTDQQLSAIGIKYFDKMDYVSKIIKTTSFKNNIEANSAQVFFDYYGNLSSATDKMSKQFYLDNVMPFDVQNHLKGEVAFWEYEKNETGNVVAFRLVENDITYVSATIDPLSSLTQMTIHYKILDRKSNKKSKFDLVCSFDNQQRLIEKQIFQKQYLVWREKPNYDNGFLEGYNRYAVNEGKESVIFTATNSFFSKQDLPRPLNNLTAGTP